MGYIMTKTGINNLIADFLTRYSTVFLGFFYIAIATKNAIFLGMKCFIALNQIYIVQFRS